MLTGMLWGGDGPLTVACMDASLHQARWRANSPEHQQPSNLRKLWREAQRLPATKPEKAAATANHLGAPAHPSAVKPPPAK